MVQGKSLGASGLFLCFLSAAFVLFASGSALAQVAAGCKQEVKDAMDAKAEARVGVGIASNEEIVDKPDSVLAVSCFNQLAGNAASAGGSIFSGDYTTKLAPVVDNALSTMYGQFTGSANENLMGGNLYQAASQVIGPWANCAGVGGIWSAIEGKGVTSGAPFLTFDDIMTAGTPGAAGVSFGENWQSGNMQTAITNLVNAVNNLPGANIPSFSTDTSSCDVLMTAGIIPGPCP